MLLLQIQDVAINCTVAANNTNVLYSIISAC
jgi:hypothetical protein